MATINLDLKSIATVVGLMVTMAAGIGSYYVVRSDVNNLKATIEKQEQKILDLQIKSTIDSTTLGNMGKQVEEIGKDVKELLQR